MTHRHAVRPATVPGRRTGLAVIGALVAVTVCAGLAACGASSATPGRHSAGRPVEGGTAYFAEQPLAPPTYIFPLVSDAYYSPANTSDLQTLLYRPLLWFGDRGRPTFDPALSLGDAPIYSDHDRVVTITLKPNRWSDGEPVSARDVGFWIDLLKANRTAWASYVRGGFPDNVVAWRAVGERTVRLILNRSYDPLWFTDNELSQITPLPIAWDRTSLAHTAPKPTAANLPDTTAAGARAVYAFLNAQSRDVSGWARSPVWSIVDGPWRLIGLTSAGEATFTPNRRYTGPQKPHLARFVELPFTSQTAELTVLRAEPSAAALDTGGTAGSRITVGYLPDEDLPQEAELRREGFGLVRDQPFGFDYLEPNFDNPRVGAILRQLYVRQAFQHLIDQPGWIRAYDDGAAVPTYSPVPAEPANPYADAQSARNPYPFSVAAARSLLRAHGWRVRPGATTSCVRAGSGPGRCGAGIPAGDRLTFTLLYPTGSAPTEESMADLQATARRVGIEITLRSASASAIDGIVDPCTPSSPACSWELGNYGASWLFEPDHDPTGEEIFQTGALGNVGSYSNPTIDRLIRATTTAPPARARQALDAYADAVRLALPDFWQPSPGAIDIVQSNLHGFAPNAYDFISPEEWYFTK